MPLASMKRALENPANVGFIRPDAYLAVVVLSDEDDCSGAREEIFDPSATQFGSALGVGFRCVEYGIQCCPAGNPLCDPKSLISRSPAEYTACEARTEADAYLHQPKYYADWLKQFKGSKNLVIAAGIIGNAEPVIVYDRPITGGTIPDLRPSCQSAQGEADPGVRLAQFFNEFEGQGTITSICNDNLADALTVVAQLLARVVGNPCLEGDLPTDGTGALLDIDSAEPGLQLNCQVSDVQFPGTDDAIEHVIPRCQMIDATTFDPSSSYPCWWTDVDAVSCPTTPHNAELVIERNGVDPPLQTSVIISCIVE